MRSLQQRLPILSGHQNFQRGRDHGLGGRHRPQGQTPRRVQVQVGTMKKKRTASKMIKIRKQQLHIPSTQRDQEGNLVTDARRTGQVESVAKWTEELL